MEIDDRLYRHGNSESKKEALSKYLEAMFGIERNSDASEKLINQVTNASPVQID